MKKIHFIAVLFPLLGCSHFENAEKQNMPLNTNQSVIEKESENKTEHQVRVQTIMKREPKKENILQKQLLNVPLIKQNPELKYGCEVTSLTMMLQYAGIKVNKMDLYRKIKKDPDPLIRSKTGDIIRWGDPGVGFVGDMTGRNAGYAVFDKPMVDLINTYLPGRAKNLTNRPFVEILSHVSKGYPVVVWTTGDYRLPDRWESWRHEKQTIKTPLDLHVVVLVGYDSQNVYLNDPLSGKKQVRVNKNRFIDSWKALKQRAVSYE
ncbi:peptidase C39 [Bacillus methanolicus]|uniref:C39 family peptidase n=1 Tax=Bacillus methanolicus TaxID=1471 RepID=UPI0023803776|nr:C39 family peptidase [Bacillus methanolicus]MDE3838340.1 peptidase C39 [Bacillus methanolicus]